MVPIPSGAGGGWHHAGGSRRRYADGAARNWRHLCSPDCPGRNADIATAARTAASAVDPALEAAGRLGVDIPRYMATESTAIPQLAAGIKNVPLAGQPIVSSAERLAEQLGTVKKGLGAGTAETAGERAKTGLTGFIKTESQKPVSEAYRAVDELIDPAVRVPLDNTRAMVGEIMAERTAARIPGRSKAVETVFDAVQDPAGMDYKGTKGLRSFLGEKSPQELAVSGLAPTEVKRLYGALTKDLSAVVRESSPEAFGKWQEANALARLTNMQRKALSKVTGAAGDAAPEMVFNRLVGLCPEQGRGRSCPAAAGQAGDGAGCLERCRLGADPSAGASPGWAIQRAAVCDRLRQHGAGGQE